jgi:hypothetical protein
MRISEKVLSVLVVILAVTASVSCNGGKNGSKGVTLQATPGDTAKIFFTEYEHNFGKVVEGEKVACVFTFENRGTAPLVITSATTSCGCTVSNYDNKPVAPGGKGTIEVVFDSDGRNGTQTKTITVTSNASKPIVLLKITGEVVLNSKN